MFEPLLVYAIYPPIHFTLSSVAPTGYNIIIIISYESFFDLMRFKSTCIHHVIIIPITLLYPPRSMDRMTIDLPTEQKLSSSLSVECAINDDNDNYLNRQDSLLYRTIKIRYRKLFHFYDNNNNYKILVSRFNYHAYHRPFRFINTLTH